MKHLLEYSIFKPEEFVRIWITSEPENKIIKVEDHLKYIKELDLKSNNLYDVMNDCINKGWCRISYNFEKFNIHTINMSRAIEIIKKYYYKMIITESLKVNIETSTESKDFNLINQKDKIEFKKLITAK
jgi:hypothetical protein